jgi:hypothetical protein
MDVDVELKNSFQCRDVPKMELDGCRISLGI